MNLTSIHDINVTNNASESLKDCIKILNVTNNNNGTHNISIQISNLSDYVKNIIYDNDNFCYIALFNYIGNAKNNVSSYKYSHYPRGTEPRKWGFKHNGNNSDVYWIPISNPNGSSSTTVTINDSDLCSQSGRRLLGHHLMHANYDHYTENFIFRLILVYDLDDIGRTGWKSCYSNINSDKLAVSYN